MTTTPFYVNNARFRTEYFEPRRRLFERLAREGQHPQLLYIGCADSRVTPEFVTAAEPGQVFVARNIGNLVPSPYSASVSVGAFVEYGIHHLHIPHIAVCGHTGCGGVKAIAGGVAAMPAGSPLRTWLTHAGWVPDAPGDLSPATLTRLVKRNVLQQIEHLKMYPVVSEALTARRVTLHAWIYEIETGGLTEYSEAEGDFVPLGE